MEPVRRPYSVGLAFKSGSRAEFKAALTDDQVNELRQAVHAREQSVSIGNPFGEQVVFNAVEVEFFQIVAVSP